MIVYTRTMQDQADLSFSMDGDWVNGISALSIS